MTNKIKTDAHDNVLLVSHDAVTEIPFTISELIHIPPFSMNSAAALCPKYDKSIQEENKMTEQEETLADLIKIKPRLCRVFDSKVTTVKHIRVIKLVDANGYYIDKYSHPWRFAELLPDEEIKQFLSGE